MLTDVDVRNVVADSLYVESGWPTMVNALALAMRNGDYRFFFCQAEGATERIRLALNTTDFGLLRCDVLQ